MLPGKTPVRQKMHPVVYPRNPLLGCPIVPHPLYLPTVGVSHHLKAEGRAPWPRQCTLREVGLQQHLSARCAGFGYPP